jgi:acetylornithine aminotransferase
MSGVPELREQVALKTERLYGRRTDPVHEVTVTSGATEALFCAIQAFVHAGDEVIVLDPAYDSYEPATRLAGGRTVHVPLTPPTFAVDWQRVRDAITPRTRMIVVNSPHNPTGAVLDQAAGARVVALARRHGFWVASDEAYGDLWFEGGPPGTLLQHGLDNLLGLYTLSKRSAMTGFRSGFMAGDARLVEALRRFRPNVGVATPDFIQDAAIAAWNDDAHTPRTREVYAAKRRLMLEAFARRGWTVEASEATFYLWMRVPDGDDVAFVEALLRLGIVTTPGSYLGEGGAGYVRWALVPTLAQCREAIARLEQLAGAKA